MSYQKVKNETPSELKNIAIIGNGGRENALAWAIQKNNVIENIFLIPGNGGSNLINKCHKLDIDYEDVNKLIKKLIELEINLIIIGPEIPLANGLSDTLRSHNFNVFGPGADGARLEASKSWAKNFMKEAKIPTANFWRVSSIEDAKNIIINSTKPLVVKADGLASGKGVFIPETKDETLVITEEILNGKFGKSGETVVLEEKIEGPEVSVFAICDGQNYIILPTAQDHKRIGEQDTGLNTGGMGAYAPTPLISEKELLKINDEIIKPTINELIKRNIDYRGVLYFGLMITDLGAKVIEYNCRFGDPECQTIMPLMDNQFVNLLYQCSLGTLEENKIISCTNRVSGCVITSSKGYPLDYEIGFPIQIDTQQQKDFQIFHSGTIVNSEGELVTNGGRVLSIVCQGKDYDEVFNKAYAQIESINFDGIYFRKDIGHQVRNKSNEARN